MSVLFHATAAPPKIGSGEVLEIVVDTSTIPEPPGHTYDYVEPIANPEPVVTRIISSETYSTPIRIESLIGTALPEDFSIQSGRLIYGHRLLETSIPGTAIYWNTWNGVYDVIKNTILYVAALKITQPVYNYLFSVITGFSPQDSSTVGIEIGYSYNTYMRQTQIQSSPDGPWETYYTAYRYDYFRYDRATVTNPQGVNPPLYQYVYNPTSTPDRQGISPNYNNQGVLSERGILLYQNYCPAGWETEDQTYYPLDYS